MMNRAVNLWILPYRIEPNYIYDGHDNGNYDDLDEMRNMAIAGYRELSW